MQIHVLMYEICRRVTVQRTLLTQLFQFKQDLVPVTGLQIHPLWSLQNVWILAVFFFQLYWLLSQTLTYHKHLHDKMSNTQPHNNSHTKAQNTTCSVSMFCQQNVWQYIGCTFSCVSEYGNCITQKVCIHREFRAIRQVKLQGKSEL